MNNPGMDSSLPQSKRVTKMILTLIENTPLTMKQRKAIGLKLANPKRTSYRMVKWGGR